MTRDTDWQREWEARNRTDTSRGPTAGGIKKDYPTPLPTRNLDHNNEPLMPHGIQHPSDDELSERVLEVYDMYRKRVEGRGCVNAAAILTQVHFAKLRDQ